MKNALMPNVYICIEQKNREYDAQLLLAAELSLQGFRCYVGTHAAIWALLKTSKQRSGIYLDKGTQLPRIMEWVRTKSEYLVIMDVELGPVIRNIDLMFSDFRKYPKITRLYNGSIELMDLFLCIGPKVYEGARKAFVGYENKVLTSGWPRVDIWEHFGVQLYRDEISAIQKKYGSFLLFTSDFTDISRPKLSESQDVRKLEDGWDPDKNFDFFLRTVSILKQWDSDSRVPKIVIRPHISEDPRIWNRELGSLKKTVVVHQGDLTPWILASKGVIHRGSTAAIQATLGKKPTFYLERANNLDRDHPSIQVSSYFVDEKNIPVLNVSNELAMSLQKIKDEYLSKVVYFPQGGATRNVVRILSTLEPTPIERSEIFSLLKSQFTLASISRMLGLIKHELLWSLKLTKFASQLHYTPGGLGNFEIKRMLKMKPEYDAKKARRMTVNLWEISK